MSLFDDASLVLTPNGVKSGKVYSIKPTDGVGDFDFTRASSATRVNSDGLIETVSTGVPRLDYPPLGDCPSLLLEPQRTNNLERSEEFDNAYWVESGATITANQIISPSGALNADLITGVSVGFGIVRFATWNATNKVASCFAKKGSTNLFRIRNTAAGGVTYNLENGTVTNEDSGFEGSIENYGNGWYRCIAIDTLGRTGGVNLSVTAASESVYIWGAQLESGSHAASYIPTVASTVTRVAETTSKTGLSSYINSSEGVLFMEAKALGSAIASDRFLKIDDGTSDNVVRIGFGSTTNSIIGDVVLATVSQCSFSSTDYTVTNNNKIALVYKANYFALFINGVKIAEDLSGSTFSASTLSILTIDAGVIIKQIQYFDSELTDQELEQLTSL